jgi:hypothetical protein
VFYRRKQTITKRLSDEQTKARKVQKEYEDLLAEQKVKTQPQSKPIVPKQEAPSVNRSTNMASGNSSVVNSNKTKHSRTRMMYLDWFEVYVQDL